MDVKQFSKVLLRSLADIEAFESVSLQVEGPTVNGRGYLDERSFVRFYFNEVTGTLAFALIEEQRRTWGIDFDNRRGWHLHPLSDVTRHISIPPLSVLDVVAQLRDALLKKGLMSDQDDD
jgi:hypothetical protein